jgi:hypothetical protein
MTTVVGDDDGSTTDGKVVGRSGTTVGPSVTIGLSVGRFDGAVEGVPVGILVSYRE